MAYCSFDDVQGLLPKIDFTSLSSKPTQVQVESYIAFCDSQVKGVLQSAGYDTTQTDVDAIAFLKMVCTFGAAALAEKAAFPGAKNGEGWHIFWQLYQDELTNILNGQAPGLEPASDAGQALPESLYTVDSAAVPDAKFTIGSVQW